MDIAAMSMAMSQMKLSQEVGVAVMKKAMDSSEGQMADLMKMMEVNTRIMEQSVNPNIGGTIDIKL